jgi:hypothetical protein
MLRNVSVRYGDPEPSTTMFNRAMWFSGSNSLTLEIFGRSRLQPIHLISVQRALGDSKIQHLPRTGDQDDWRLIPADTIQAPAVSAETSRLQREVAHRSVANSAVSTSYHGENVRFLAPLMLEAEASILYIRADCRIILS